MKKLIWECFQMFKSEVFLISTSHKQAQIYNIISGIPKFPWKIPEDKFILHSELLVHIFWFGLLNYQLKHIFPRMLDNCSRIVSKQFLNSLLMNLSANLCFTNTKKIIIIKWPNILSCQLSLGLVWTDIFFFSEVN